MCWLSWLSPILNLGFCFNLVQFFLFIILHFIPKKEEKRPLIGISPSRKKLKQISLIWVCIHMYFNLDSAVIVGFFFLWWGGGGRFFSYSFLCKNSLVLLVTKVRISIRRLDVRRVLVRKNNLALFVTKARISIRGLIWGVVWWSNFRFPKLEARS